MAKYAVIRGWHGVKAGDTVEYKGEVPRALRANVRRVGETGTEHAAKEDEALKLPPVAPASKSK